MGTAFVSAGVFCASRDTLKAIQRSETMTHKPLTGRLAKRLF
jgi:hypothetical protein